MKKVVSLVLFACLAMVGCVNQQQNQKATAVASVNGVEISSAEKLFKLKLLNHYNKTLRML